MAALSSLTFEPHCHIHFPSLFWADLCQSYFMFLSDRDLLFLHFGIKFGIPPLFRRHSQTPTWAQLSLKLSKSVKVP